MAPFIPVFFINGILLTLLGIAELVPSLLDLAYGHDDWQVFLASAFVTIFFGSAMAMATRRERIDLTLRAAFVLTASSWIVIPIFAALPFAFSDLQMSYTDAFFEAMSGLTTTGSTVITGLDGAPPGILIWRALLQWLGGIGIVVMAFAILPMLQVGGMQLFHMESSDKSDKVMPRATQIAAVIVMIYLALSLICAIGYWLAGMSPFEAAAHAMTTIATGGFSTSDGSIGHFDSSAVDFLAALFMVIGSLPFLLYYQIVRGRPLEIWRDEQVRTFFAIIALVITALVAWRMLSGGVPFYDALRYCTLNAISIVTGTGYSSTDYGLWGPFAVTLFFFAMLIGGCAGSTSCGIKIFRFQVLYGAARVQISRLLQPHGVFIPHFNRQPIADSVVNSVMSFFYLFALSFAVLTVLLSALGLDTVTAISAAATAIANVGPGLGDVIGPAGTFKPLPDTAKWLLSAGMLLGRLELFTIFVLFTRNFWRV